MRPDTNSTVRRPLVRYQGELGLAAGLFISMRLLSKYCTRRLPPAPCWYSSLSPAVLGAGPQNQVRLTLPEATGLSVRRQVVSKAGPAKEAGADGAAAAAGAGIAPTPEGETAWASTRTRSVMRMGERRNRGREVMQPPRRET